MSSKQKISKKKRTSKKISPKNTKIGGNNSSGIIFEKPELLEQNTTSTGIKWKKLGSDGSEYLELYLKDNQEVIADKHAVVYMKNGIKAESKMGGLIKGISRKFAGEYAFMTHFTGITSTPSKLALSLPVSGDILHIKIKPGEEWNLSKFVFLASTNNVELSATLNVRGLVTKEGVALTSVKAIHQEADLWVCAYGHVEEHKLDYGEEIFIKPGNFLAAHSFCKHTLSKNSIFGAITGLDLFSMKFTGPCIVYTHSGNIQNLSHMINLHNPGLTEALKVLNSKNNISELSY
jgi:uncharacterized protein (AIM24 family)